MSENTNKVGFWKQLGMDLGFVRPQEVSEKRSDTVIYGPASAPSARTAGTVLTTGDALSLVAVYRAVSILSTSVKQMGMEVYRQGVQIDAPLLVKSPSTKVNRAVVMEETVMSLALTGNAYWRLYRTGQYNQVQAIEVLNPHSVRIEHDNGVVKAYRYGDKKFSPDEIKHLALLRVPGSVYGLGPIQAAQATLVGAADVRDYSSNWFSQGNIPAGVLKTEQVINSEQATAYRTAFEESITGGGTAVLGQGVNYSPIYLSPRDAQFLETQQWTKTEIATLFGIPSIYMLADNGNNSSTYSNQQQVDVAFLKFGVSQYLIEIEQAFSDLLPRGQEARFNTESLLRTDTKARFEAFQIGINSGFMTVNEVRAIEGLAPIEGGDELAKPTTTNEQGGQST